MPEEVIKPELPIIDTHIHLWDHRSGYRYFIEEYAKEVAACGHHIDAAVYVQCDSMYRATGPEYLKYVGETEFAVGQAAIAASGKYTKTRVAAAIVGTGDLRLADKVDELLDAHVAAGNGRFRGIRQRAKWDPDPVVKSVVHADQQGLYLDAGFQQGLKKLAARDLHFEASIYHPQILDVIALARAVPEARIVLVHSGSPVGFGAYAGRLKEVHEFWLSGMKELAKCPNVSIKLGGFIMTLATFDFGKAARPIDSDELARQWRPFTEPCVELFGVDRCMVSSNFPVDKVGFTYRTAWNMFKRMFAGCSDAEQRALLSGTAREFYRI
jgi:predicted TIM-barrel fold metal-dependent hydrolase